MATLTHKKRSRMRPQSFALEVQRKYPIHDITHARNALARVAANGTPAEKYEVRREVFAKYPQLKGGKSYQAFLRQRRARNRR